jgi:thioredoxin reductase (NADPH)
VTEFLDEWWRLRGVPFEGIRVIGDPRSPRTHEISDLLQRHDFPYGYYQSDSDAGLTLLRDAGLAVDRLPVVVLHDGRSFVDPTNTELADALGARTRPGPGAYDIVIVGAGPAGLAAAVYARRRGSAQRSWNGSPWAVRRRPAR